MHPPKSSRTRDLLAWSLRLAWAEGRGVCLAWSIANVLWGCLPLAYYHLFAGFVNELTHPSRAYPTAVAIGALAIVVNLLEQVPAVARAKLEPLMQRTSGALVATSLGCIEVDRLETQEVQDAAAKAMAFKPIDIVAGFMSLASTGLTAVTGIVYVIERIPFAGTLMVLSSIPLLFAIGRTNRLAAELSRRRAADQRRMDYFATLLAGRESSAEVRLFSTADYLLSRFKEIHMDTFREIYSFARRRDAIEILYEMLPTGIAILVAVLIFVRMEHGESSLGFLLSSIAAVRNFRLAVGWLPGPWRTIGGGLEGARNLTSLLAISSGGGQRTVGRKPWPAEGAPEVRLDHVSYRYPNGAVGLIDVSIVVPRGKVTAIVGANGAGKSTLVRLVAGLARPTAGGLAVNGVPYDQITPDEFVRARSGVLQPALRYNGAVRDGLGDWVETDGTRESLLRAAGVAVGLDELVGDELPEHRNLSGGQWQRMALARSLGKGSKLVVLDEVTAAQDPVHELEVVRAIRSLREQTIIVVTHRLGLVLAADHVIVMSDQHVVDEGPARELLARSEPMKRLFSRQLELMGTDAG